MSTTATDNARLGARNVLATILSHRIVIFIAVFAVLAVLFQVGSDGLFLTPRNLSIMLRQGAILAVLAAGVALLMTMSEIDLSIGSSVFLCGVTAATLATTTELPLPAIVAATIATGIGLGLIQGFVVVVIGIPSFIATLAGLLAFRGVGLLWTNAATVGPVTPGFQALSESFIPIQASLLIIGAITLVAVAAVIYRGARGRVRARKTQIDGSGLSIVGSRPSIASIVLRVALVVIPLGGLGWIVGGFQGLPMALVWVAVIVGSLSLVMSRTVYGRAAYLLGTNREAAVYAGIAVKRTVLVGFLVMGALYGVGALLLTARLGSSNPGAGQFFELDAIAAAVIGGVSLRGGTGTIVGAAIGALLLTTINNGMSILNISSFSQLVIKGLILVLALGLDAYVLRRAAR